MSYYETFEKLRKALQKTKFEQGDRHIAIQVRITDPDASGIYYIEDFGDRVLAEPYNYYDNDVEIIGTSSVLSRLFQNSLSFEDALSDNAVTVNGDINALEYFFGRMVTTPAKKTTTKSTTKSRKKTEVKKMNENKNEVKKPKDTETIKEVVEKEVKPKKK